MRAGAAGPAGALGGGDRAAASWPGRPARCRPAPAGLLAPHPTPPPAPSRASLSPLPVWLGPPPSVSIHPRCLSISSSPVLPGTLPVSLDLSHCASLSQGGAASLTPRSSLILTVFSLPLISTPPSPVTPFSLCSERLAVLSCSCLEQRSPKSNSSHFPALGPRTSHPNPQLQFHYL